MTIKGLYDVIEKHAPGAIGRVPITFYKGKKVAVDAHNWMFKTMYGARKISARKTNFAIDNVDNTLTRTEWVKLSLNFVIKWLHFGVTPIFVFDGTYKPEKGETQRKRGLEYKKKIEAYHKTVDELNQVDILDRTPEMVAEVRDKFTSFIDLNIDEINNLIHIFDVVGLPWVQAIGEAEQLCTMLALEGKVDAVFSRDGDNLALGCPVLLKEYSTNLYEGGKTIPTLEYYELDIILRELEMNMDEFLDLCIFLGCDYNTNVKGIGPVRALKLIRDHGSVSEIRRSTDIDTSCLNYENCLVNFKKIDSTEITLGGRIEMKSSDIFSTRDILEINGVAIMTKQLCGAMAEVEELHSSVNAKENPQTDKTESSGSSSGKGENKNKTKVIKINRIKQNSGENSKLKTRIITVKKNAEAHP